MNRARKFASVELVPGAASHVSDLAQRLRSIDRAECWAMGQTAEQALQHGLTAGAKTWTALIDNNAHAMFGVVLGDADHGVGIPWFLGSDRVAQQGRLLIVQGPAIVAEMHCHARCLCNFVSSNNRQAIRLLEHWGFAVERDVVFAGSMAFRRFIREIK